jgi:hypothetical protein
MPTARYFRNQAAACRDQAAMCLEIARRSDDPQKADNMRVTAARHVERAVGLERFVIPPTVPTVIAGSPSATRYRTLGFSRWAGLSRPKLRNCCTAGSSLAMY